MSYKTRKQIEAHDAAGFESAYTDFSEYDDGYGNKVAHGDLSVLHMVEGGMRDATWPESVPDENVAPRAIDTHPFMSQSQHRKFRSMEAKGELPRGTADRWASETPGEIKDLPEKKR